MKKINWKGSEKGRDNKKAKDQIKYLNGAVNSSELNYSYG
jgi:hypothetical protein